MIGRAALLALALLAGPVVAQEQAVAQAGPDAAAQALEYAAQCRAEVGALPDFDCADGVPVPVTVDGVTITDAAPASCDRPALLSNGAGSDGQCVPHSRILNLSTKTMQVSVMCRQKRLRLATSSAFDEIDVIAHNPATGATCWFQAKAAEGPVSGADVPSPTEHADGGFWRSPAEVVADGCGDCHDNDPFMYSPFVGQVWQAVPQDPAGPYRHVAPAMGFGDWPLTALDLRDNTCLGCHRIGLGRAVNGEKPGSCGALAAMMTGQSVPPGADARAQAWPLSHAMPPGPGAAMTETGWNTIYGPSLGDIRSCCEDPDQPMCKLSQIPSWP